jgi:hypothetical protein
MKSMVINDDTPKAPTERAAHFKVQMEHVANILP